jgi:hypothetical protein
MHFTTPWFPVPDAQAPLLVTELHRELAPSHVLYGATVKAIARRQDCDDVLFQVLAPHSQFAVVHLTFSGRAETSPQWPSTEIFASLDEFVRDRMQRDSEGWE